MERFRNVLLMAVVAYLCLIHAAFSDVETKWRVYGEGKESIQLPDIPGYVTLKCDFHMHTVFSDGLVWPTIRVEEAWRDGLDAISISDHIEYQPHKEDIPTNHNRPYEITHSYAAMKNFLFPRATEITRSTPPGHFNAIFLNDINPLDTEEFIDAIEAANKQGAFVFWNHPGWKGPELGSWRDIHTTIYEKKWLHGIEVCNGGSYYPEAHQWAMEKNLTMMGNTDIHQPIIDFEHAPENHRTMTLVFAREKTMEALKEALFAGRTAVWFKNQLIGREEYLEPLFKASVRIAKPHRHVDNTYWMEIENKSDVIMEMEKTGDHGPGSLTLPANASILLQMEVKKEADDGVDEIVLSYRVKNLLVAPEEGLEVDLTVPIE